MWSSWLPALVLALCSDGVWPGVGPQLSLPPGSRCVPGRAETAATGPAGPGWEAGLRSRLLFDAAQSHGCCFRLKSARRCRACGRQAPAGPEAACG